MGASGTGGTVVMLLASKEYGEKKKRFKGMQDDYRLRPNVWCKYRRKKKSSFILTQRRIYRNQLGTRCTAKLLV